MNLISFQISFELYSGIPYSANAELLYQKVYGCADTISRQSGLNDACTCPHFRIFELLVNNSIWLICVWVHKSFYKRYFIVNNICIIFLPTCMRQLNCNSNKYNNIHISYFSHRFYTSGVGLGLAPGELAGAVAGCGVQSGVEY